MTRSALFALALLFPALFLARPAAADCQEGVRDATPKERARYQGLQDKLAGLCKGPKGYTRAPLAPQQELRSLCVDEGGHATLRPHVQAAWIDRAGLEKAQAKVLEEVMKEQAELMKLQGQGLDPTKPNPRMKDLFERLDALQKRSEAIEEEMRVSFSAQVNDDLVWAQGARRVRRKVAPVVLEETHDDGSLRMVLLYGSWAREGTDSTDVRWAAHLDPSRPSTLVQSLSITLEGTKAGVEALLASCDLAAARALIGH